MSELRPFASVILAAGEGTRMRSSLPKLAHRLAGKALLRHVLDAVLPLGPVKNIAVVPPGNKMVSDLVKDEMVCVPQPRLLGTGHALAQARPALSALTGDILVLCGDVPLVTSVTLRKLLAFHQREGLAGTILTARLKDPTGYGRILRKSNGKVMKIVEEPDADFYQKVVEEVNSGIYCFQCPRLWDILEQVGNKNQQKEYYLTDAVQLLVESNLAVDTSEVDDPREILGINTRSDLARAESIFQERVARQHQERGVTIVRPELTYIEDGVEIGPETVIFPFTIIERGARIGRECRIGPYLRLKSGQEISDFSVVEGNGERSEHR